MKDLKIWKDWISSNDLKSISFNNLKKLEIYLKDFKENPKQFENNFKQFIENKCLTHLNIFMNFDNEDLYDTAFRSITALDQLVCLHIKRYEVNSSNQWFKTIVDKMS